MAVVVGVVELELDPDCTPTQRPLMLMWEETTVAVSVSGGTADAASPLMMTLRLPMVVVSPVFPCGTSVRWLHR